MSEGEEVFGNVNQELTQTNVDKDVRMKEGRREGEAHSAVVVLWDEGGTMRQASRYGRSQN